MTPIRNDPGRVRSPHANVWDRLVPHHLPTGKKAGIRSQIDLPNSELHCATIKVRLECAGDERGRLFGPVLFMSYYYSLRLAMHSSQHTAAADLIEAQNVLALPKPRSFVLELGTVYQCTVLALIIRTPKNN